MKTIKQLKNETPIKVIVTNPPTKEEAKKRIEELSALLSKTMSKQSKPVP